MTVSFISPAGLRAFEGPILDCRFDLHDSDAGARAYAQGHVPGAHYLDLARDLSGPVGRHGGRHPLPSPRAFADRLAGLGLRPEQPVALYDDSRYAFAARCWWMLRGLGFQRIHLLSGGYAAWLRAGGPTAGSGEESPASAVAAATVAPWEVPTDWPLLCERADLAGLQARGALLVDAREAMRYRGEQEPIDPLAGHIPGAENLPWQGFSDELGMFLDPQSQRQRWGDLLQQEALVLYCGSGVSACVNLLSLELLGRADALLYGGSWSDWCSFLQDETDDRH